MTPFVHFRQCMKNGNACGSGDLKRRSVRALCSVSTSKCTRDYCLFLTRPQHRVRCGAKRRHRSASICTTNAATIPTIFRSNTLIRKQLQPLQQPIDAESKLQASILANRQIALLNRQIADASLANEFRLLDADRQNHYDGRRTGCGDPHFWCFVFGLNFQTHFEIQH